MEIQFIFLLIVNQLKTQKNERCNSEKTGLPKKKKNIGELGILKINIKQQNEQKQDLKKRNMM